MKTNIHVKVWPSDSITGGDMYEGPLSYGVKVYEEMVADGYQEAEIRIYNPQSGGATVLACQGYINEEKLEKCPRQLAERIRAATHHDRQSRAAGGSGK